MPVPRAGRLATVLMEPEALTCTTRRYPPAGLHTASRDYPGVRPPAPGDIPTVRAAPAAPPQECMRSGLERRAAIRRPEPVPTACTAPGTHTPGWPARAPTPPRASGVPARRRRRQRGGARLDHCGHRGRRVRHHQRGGRPKYAGHRRGGPSPALQSPNHPTRPLCAPLAPTGAGVSWQNATGLHNVAPFPGFPASKLVA